MRKKLFIIMYEDNRQLKKRYIMAISKEEAKKRFKIDYSDKRIIEILYM